MNKDTAPYIFLIIFFAAWFSFEPYAHADVFLTFPSTAPTGANGAPSFVDEFSAPFIQFEDSINRVSRNFHFNSSMSPTNQTIQTAVNVAPQYYRKITSVVAPIIEAVKPLVRFVGGLILVVFRLVINIIQAALSYLAGK